MTRRRTLLLALAAVVLLVAGGLVLVLRDGGSKPTAGGVASDTTAMIRTSDGITLAAEVVRPRGSDKPPLVVMPASWGQPQTEYRAIARKLATDGYLVVAYAQRGFGASGGTVDLAGSRTQADARQVVDWALQNTPADAGRIGMFGISYGAGIALLAAAKDPRIKVVAALSTWTDLGASFDPGGTGSTRALAALIGSGSGLRPGADVRRLQTLLTKDPRAVGKAMQALSRTRSPMTYVDDLNRNKPAIMMANSFEDSFFPPAQLTTFFDALTTPKRLQLAPGDHGTQDAAGLGDGRSGTVGDARAWLDHYLRGVANGIDTEAPIVLTDAASGKLLALKSFPTGDRIRRVGLGRPNTDGSSGTNHATVWRAPILAGKDTVATSGDAVAPFTPYRIPKAELARLDRSRGLAWSDVVGDDPLTVAGAPTVSFEVTANRTNATIVSYLYDLGAGGTSRLMSVQPLSLRGLTPGKARATTFTLQPIAWTVPAGHAVVLVVDTVDPRYTGFNAAGTAIAVSSSKARPATLSLPTVRE